jgi:predicted PurR-regulated permease PerM
MATNSLKLDLEWRALIKIGLAVVVVWAWLILWPFIMAVLVSIFVAVALQPVAQFLERRGLPNALASSLPVLLLAIIIGGFIAVAWSSIQTQTLYILPAMESMEHKIREELPILNQVLGTTDVTGPSLLLRYGTELGRSTLEAVVLIIIGLILTMYLLIERRQTLDWAISFFPRDRRQKVRHTLGEVRKVALNYVAGNMVTATFAGVFVFASMSFLGVRAPLLLALLAAFCDFIPILGFLLSGMPALLLGSASGVSVFVILGLYVFYHVVETYVIFPKIYGDRLKLSTVAVVVAFAIGAELGGVIGAILALPIAAIYPSIERIWLGRYLGDDVVEDHQRTDKSAEITT